MPLLGGRETLRLLRSRSHSRHVPVLLFSTSNQPTDKQFAARYEAGLLTKPLDSQQMECILMRIMNLCRQGHRDHLSGNRN
jgi:CheY-like chemotaxis protein